MDATAALMDRWHVLVVDDDETIGSLVAEMLAMSGYETTTARSYQEAIAAAGGQRIDLVISDIVLGVGAGDGLDVVEGVLALQPCAKTLFISGYAKHGTLTDDDPLLPKPFDLRQLLDRVESLLGTGA